MFRTGGRIREWKLLILFPLICIFFIAFNTPHRKIPLLKEVEGWESNITRETKNYVLPEKDTNIISGRGLCEGTTELIIIVFSAPENFAQRYAIRETWGSYNITSVRVAFLLGCSKNSSSQFLVEMENTIFQDVVQEDFVDSYNNLTVKSVIMLKWFLNKCPFTTFLMKTDDDVFINMKTLFALISKIDKHSSLTGSLICKKKPILDPESKWYTPKYMYQEPFYPNYLSGVAYVISRDVAMKLYTAALSTDLILLEDAYITGICAAKAGIVPRNHNGFSNRYFGTICYAELITSHGLNPKELRQVWNQRNNCTLKIDLSRIHLNSHGKFC